MLIDIKKKLAPWLKSFKKVLFVGPFGVSWRGVVLPELCQNIFLLNIYWYKKRNWLPKLSHSKNWFSGGTFGKFPGGVILKLCQNICLLYMYCYQKNWNPRLSCSKKWFLGGSTPKLRQNICLLNIYRYQKNWRPSSSHSKKWFFGAPFRGGCQGSGPKNFGRQNCVCNSKTLHKNWISVLCGLEERTRLRKKEKKPHCGHKCVGRDERIYLPIYNHVKCFLPYSSSF